MIFGMLAKTESFRSEMLLCPSWMNFNALHFEKNSAEIAFTPAKLKSILSSFSSLCRRVFGRTLRCMFRLRFRCFRETSIVKLFLDISVKWLSLKSRFSKEAIVKGGPARFVILFWDKSKLIRIFSRPVKASEFKELRRFLDRSKYFNCWKSWNVVEGSSRTIFFDITSFTTFSANDLNMSLDKAATRL